MVGRLGEARPLREAPEAIKLSVLPGGRRKLEIRTSVVVCLLALLIVVAAAVASVVGRAVVDRQQMRLDAMNAKLQTATLQEEQLRLEVAQLSAPGRIVSVAERLGLVVPNQTTYVSPAGSAGKSS